MIMCTKNPVDDISGFQLKLHGFVYRKYFVDEHMHIDARARLQYSENAAALCEPKDGFGNFYEVVPHILLNQH